MNRLSVFCPSCRQSHVATFEEVDRLSPCPRCGSRTPVRVLVGQRERPAVSFLGFLRRDRADRAQVAA